MRDENYYKNSNYYTESQKIVTNILKYRYDVIPDLKNKAKIIYNLCINKFLKDKLKAKLNTTFLLLKLAEKFFTIEYYMSLIESEESNKRDNKFKINFFIVKDYFSNFEEEFNIYFFTDLKKKIDNMFYYSIIKLKEKYKMNNHLAINKKISKKIIIEISKSNFSSDVKKKYFSKSPYLDNLDENNLKILISLGSQWYKCPKGHLYVIGECGNPTEESVYPECNSKIGGLNHNPSQGNERVNIN